MTAGGRCRADAGMVGGGEVLPFAVLIFVVGGLLAANVWAVVDTRLATAAAAHHAARAYVEAPDGASADQRARRAAASTMAGHGRTAGPTEVAVAGGFSRCGPVTVRVSHPVPALTLPWIGGYGAGFTVSSSATEIVDPYRSGLDGVAEC